MGYKDEKEQEQPKKILINDSRHSRDGREASEPEPEVVAEPVAVEPEVVEAPAEPVQPTEPAGLPPEPIQFQQPQEPVATQTPVDEPSSQPPPAGGQPGEEEMTPQQAAEMEQIKLIFGAGIKTYLGGQLGIFVNFALVYLGRAPNPATGLVATNLEDARLAIDLLEVVVNGLKADFPEEEAANVANILNELKYTYMQASQGTAPPTEPTAES